MKRYGIRSLCALLLLACLTLSYPSTAKADTSDQCTILVASGSVLATEQYVRIARDVAREVGNKIHIVATHSHAGWIEVKHVSGTKPPQPPAYPPTSTTLYGLSGGVVDFTLGYTNPDYNIADVWVKGESRGTITYTITMTVDCEIPSNQG